MYAWLKRRHQPGPSQQFRLIWDTAVSQAFTEAKQCYGAPRLAEELPEYNIKTIAASLRRQGLRAKVCRKFSSISYREYGLTVPENLLKQDFYVSGSNQKWAGDITYLRTDEGRLYLAVVIDLFPLKVVGWLMKLRSSLELALDGLIMAVWRRKPDGDVIVHSD